MTFPTKFVGLHSHSLSIGDAIGYPQDHIEFARKNGMDALALTDHGHCNGFSHQYNHVKKLASQGISFKGIFGTEAYYIPSLINWQQLKDQRQSDKLKAKLDAIDSSIGDEQFRAKEELEAIASSKTEDNEDDDVSGTLVENEDESKKKKIRDPLDQRSHLVLLAKNSEGLKSIFKLVSLSNIHGFYRFPRIDLDMLRKEAKGNIIALSACVAGFGARKIFDRQTTADWESWNPNTGEAFEEIQTDLKGMVQEFQEALGPENYYLELQFNKLGPQHLVNQHLIECSKRTNTKLVVTVDAHYSNPEHWRQREIYKAMAWMSKLKDEFDGSKLPQTIDELKCELYPKNADQVWDSYLRYGKGVYPEVYTDDNLIKEAIERTHDIAFNQIGTPDVDKTVKFPKITKIIDPDLFHNLQKIAPNDEDRISFLALVEKVKEGFEFRNIRKKANYKEYLQRIQKELEVVSHLKFSKYFLTYIKIMEVVSNKMLVGAGRGSGAGFLLCYLTGITQVDPIQHGLLSERFLVKKKKGYPDIDSDVADREEALEYIKEWFGDTNVLAVSNFNGLKLRSLMKDLGKIYGIPFQEINDYTSRIESEARNEAKKEPGFDAQVWVLTYEEAEKKSASFREFLVKYPLFSESIQVLFKQMRNVSRHAGGVLVLDDGPSQIPIIKNGGVLQTPWTEGLGFRHLEDFGFLKFDVLSVGTLRKIESCIKRILVNKGTKHPTFDHIKRWFYENLHPDNNTLDDQAVYANVFWDKKFAGTFQFINPKVQELISKIKPTCVNDLATVTSLYRPGPMSIGADKAYLGNRQNPERIKYRHPLEEEVLKDTAGVLTYQEQVQLMFNKLAGIPLDETDGIRKAFNKKDQSKATEKNDAIDKLRTEFIEKCLSVNSIPPEVSNKIFDNMEGLVAYSFNKSHAISYCILAYQCAYLLYHYPDEWICAHIDHESSEKGKIAGKTDPKIVAIGEAQRLGYKIGAPDINKSDVGFIVDPNSLTSGQKVLVPSISSMKYVGKAALHEIKQFRPYSSVLDLLIDHTGNWRHTRFNKRSLETMIKLEALGSVDIVGEGKLFPNYRVCYEVLINNNELLKRTSARKKNNKIMPIIEELATKHKDIPDWTAEEKMKFLLDLSGTVDRTLLLPQEIRDKLFQDDIGPLDSWVDSQSLYWAVVSNSEVKLTKTGKPYLWLKLLGKGSADMTCMVWNWKEEDEPIAPDTIIVSMFNKDMNFTATARNIRVITQKQ